MKKILLFLLFSNLSFSNIGPFPGGSSGGSSGGVTSINTDTTAAQVLAVGTSGTDFAILDGGGGLHTFNLPSASSSARGVISTGTQSLSGVKTFLDGAVITAGKTLKNGNYVMTPGETDAGTCTTTKTIDFSTGSAQKVTVSGNCTFTLTNPVTGGVYILKLVQSSVGGYSYTWPGSVEWSANAPPSGSATGRTDIINLYYDGTFYYASAALNY